MLKSLPTLLIHHQTTNFANCLPQKISKSLSQLSKKNYFLIILLCIRHWSVLRFLLVLRNKYIYILDYHRIQNCKKKISFDVLQIRIKKKRKTKGKSNFLPSLLSTSQFFSLFCLSKVNSKDFFMIKIIGMCQE